jgi:4-amino-4-deoxy-L-arabinose transferase and related glycosyltransferases of PMT family
MATTALSSAPGTRLRAALLALACLFAFLPGIATLPPVDRDEARFVQATKQMLETGDYVDIRFQDEHRYKKPVGIYWLQSAAVKLTGGDADSEIWRYRLVSAIAGAISVFAIASLGTFMFGPLAGLAAGLMLAGLFGLGFEARLAKTDATLLAATLLAQGALARFYLMTRTGQAVPARWWWTFWLALGVGILIKGPVTPAISLLTIAGVALFDKDRAWLRALRPGAGLLLMLAVVLPWLAAITARSGIDFWNESLGRDFIGKVTSGQESHGAPPGYYVLTYSLYMWPFGLLAILGGLKALNRFREPKMLFCIAWYVPFWILVELTPTKLPHYLLPVYPAIILLGAWAFLTEQGRNVPLKRWQVWFSWLTAFGLAAVTLVFAAGSLAGPYALAGDFVWLGIPAAFLALAAGWLASGYGRPEMGIARVTAAAAASAATVGLLAGAVMPAITPMWLSPRIADRFEAARTCPDSTLAAVDFHEPSLVFLAGTETRLTDIHGAAFHLAAPDGCGLALIPEGNWAMVEGMMPPGMTIESAGLIEGVNYSNGREMRLVLLRRTR